ncbi:eukaryotic translation initiation factor 2 subunit beta [Tanacetum coccineum]
MADDDNRMEIIEELGAFDSTKKKKKKKVVINYLADGSVDQLAEKTESLAVTDGMEPTFTGLKKKKKKQAENSYEGHRQGLREGTKKTVFANFMELCKSMHRQPEHVMTFLMAELGTSGSLDGQQRLVVKGRFAPKNFEGILRRYINEYVNLHMVARAPDTILFKAVRIRHFSLDAKSVALGGLLLKSRPVLWLVLDVERLELRRLCAVFISDFLFQFFDILIKPVLSAAAEIQEKELLQNNQFGSQSVSYVVSGFGYELQNTTMVTESTRTARCDQCTAEKIKDPAVVCEVPASVYPSILETYCLALSDIG